MTRYTGNVAILVILLFCAISSALEPNEILVIVNGDFKPSVELGQYYCLRRNVPKENILSLSLGNALFDTISRDEYDKLFAAPINKKISERENSRPVKCLLTTYGVPYKVGPRGQLTDQQERLKELEALLKQEQTNLANAKIAQKADAEQNKIKQEIEIIKGKIDYITGRETNASVDSELSMVMSGTYELYRWQPNQLNKNSGYPEVLIRTIMVCRLDGPIPQIARSIIDKSLTAEKTGLNGFAYIDSRGIREDKNPVSYGGFDQNLRDLAFLLRLRTNLPVIEERTDKLFPPGSCPKTAIYCGWYSLKKYVDSFEFVDGAIGYHIASFEAMDLRDPNSTEWCPAMLMHGITATLGPVTEPYLSAFPRPADFFGELIEGKCLVEAFYRTQPFCSWQLVLIGDPLYTPFTPDRRKSQINPVK